MMPDTEPFLSEASVIYWKSGGLETLSNGIDFLEYAGLTYSTNLDQAGLVSVNVDSINSMMGAEVERYDVSKYSSIEENNYPVQIEDIGNLLELRAEMETSLRKKLDPNDGFRSNGGGHSITTTAGTAGQIIAGGFAIGHDTFISPGASSIVAGTGLIAGGLQGWPEHTQSGFEETN